MAALPGQVCYLPNGVEELFLSREIMPRGRRFACYSSEAGLIAREFSICRKRSALFCSKVPDVTLAVVGCMLPEENNQEIFRSGSSRSRAASSPLVKRADVPALYAAHDIFVFPSLAEGMPLTLLEAMATGMPIITSDAPGMADIIEDEFSGLLVQPADAADLAAAMERMCRSADLRRQLGQAAQQTARRYTWEIVTQKLERVLLLAAARQGALELKYAVLNLPCVSDTQLEYSSKLVTAFRHPLYAWLGLRPFVAQHTAAEHAALQRWANGRTTLVEIGVAEGVSALALREAMSPDRHAVLDRSLSSKPFAPR